jgi:hypothetical protein
VRSRSQCLIERLLLISSLNAAFRARARLVQAAAKQRDSGEASRAVEAIAPQFLQHKKGELSSWSSSVLPNRISLLLRFVLLPGLRDMPRTLHRLTGTLVSSTIFMHNQHLLQHLLWFLLVISQYLAEHCCLYMLRMSTSCGHVLRTLHTQRLQQWVKDCCCAEVRAAPQ